MTSLDLANPFLSLSLSLSLSLARFCVFALLPLCHWKLAEPLGIAAGGNSGLDKLTRRHAIKLSPAVSCSVEECSLGVDEIVGCKSVKSASRMNSAVVIFLDSVEEANQLLSVSLSHKHKQSNRKKLYSFRESTEAFKDECFHHI